MKYSFPVIENISQVLPAIEGDEAFIVMEKDNIRVVEYVFADNQTFPKVETENDAIRRECRGLIFDKETGKLLARRYHKFFNYGEREETLPDELDFKQPHVIFEKLDGSMVSPLIIDGNIRWTTRAGITDTSMQAEVFVSNNPEYDNLAKFCYEKNITPIFEWCSRQNRVVLDHPEDRLVLTAIRHNKTGEYFPHSRTSAIANVYGIPDVKIIKTKFKNFQSLYDNIKAQEGVEGVVIRFDTGHMIKMKADAYCRIHRAKDVLTNERFKIELVVNNSLDDVLSILDENDKKNLLDFQRDFWYSIDRFIEKVKIDYKKIKSTMTRKEFALSDFEDKKFIFKAWDNENLIHSSVMDHIKRNTNSNRNIKNIKKIIEA